MKAAEQIQHICSIVPTQSINI